MMCLARASFRAASSAASSWRSPAPRISRAAPGWAGLPDRCPAIAVATTSGDRYPIVWHQLWSSSSVATTRSAAAAPGDRSDTVTMAIWAPASWARVMALLVAHVAPSWEMPMSSPPPCGSSAASNAWAATMLPSGPLSPSPSRTISTKPWAPCSLVPQPTTTMGSRVRAVDRMSSARRAAGLAGSASRPSSRSAKAGSAAIISVMRYGGPGRDSGVEVARQGSGGPGRGRSASLSWGLTPRL